MLVGVGIAAQPGRGTQLLPSQHCTQYVCHRVLSSHCSRFKANCATGSSAQLRSVTAWYWRTQRFPEWETRGTNGETDGAAGGWAGLDVYCHSADKTDNLTIITNNNQPNTILSTALVTADICQPFAGYSGYMFVIYYCAFVTDFPDPPTISGPTLVLEHYVDPSSLYFQTVTYPAGPCLVQDSSDSVQHTCNAGVNATSSLFEGVTDCDPSEAQTVQHPIGSCDGDRNIATCGGSTTTPTLEQTTSCSHPSQPQEISRPEEERSGRGILWPFCPF